MKFSILTVAALLLSGCCVDEPKPAYVIKPEYKAAAAELYSKTLRELVGNPPWAHDKAIQVMNNVYGEPVWPLPNIIVKKP